MTKHRVDLRRCRTIVETCSLEVDVSAEMVVELCASIVRIADERCIWQERESVTVQTSITRIEELE